MPHKVKILLSLALCLMLTACTAPTSSTEENSSAESISGSTPIADRQQNFLGGSGALQVIDNRNALFLEDDAWFYLGHGKIAKNNAEKAQLISQCRIAGCMHDSTDCIRSKYYSGNGMLLSDGRDLYIEQGATLYEIAADGSQTLLFQPKQDAQGKSLDAESLQFAQLNRLDENSLLFFADAYNSAEEYVSLCGIFHRNTQTVQYPETSINSMAIQPDAANHCFYCMNMQGEILIVQCADGTATVLTAELDDQPAIGGWMVENGRLYYINLMGQYCAYDLHTKEKTLLYDISPFCEFYVNESCIYTLSADKTSLLRGDAGWENVETLYQSEVPLRGITALDEEVLLLDMETGSGILWLESGEVTYVENKMAE